MKLVDSKAFLARTILLLWVFICIPLFLVYTGKVSSIHQFLFKGMDSLLVGLSMMNGDRYLFNLVTSLFGVLTFSLSCIGLGLLVLRSFGNKFEKSIDTRLGFFAYLGTAFLLGEIVSSSIFLFLGIISKLSVTAVGIVMVTMLVLGLYPGIRMIKNIPLSLFRNQQTESAKPFTRFLELASSAIIIVALLYSSARLSYDATGMYFSNAKLIALSERIQYFSDFLLVSSLHIGIQYAALIKIFGDQAARMYSWIGGIVTLVFGLALGEKLGLSKKALTLLRVMILTSTVFVDPLGDGKIDLQTSAPMLAAIYWMVADKQINLGRGVYFLIGLLAGFSIISRLFNAFLAFLFIGLFYLWRLYSQRKNAQRSLNLLLQPALGIGLGIGSMLGVHLLANWFILGNALAPIKTITWLNSSVWHYSFDPKDIWIYRILYPFVATYINSPQSLGNISPLFLAYAPFFLLPSVRKSVKFSQDILSCCLIALIVLSLWIVLFYAVVEIRYVLFLWILLLIPVAVLMESALDSEDQLFAGLLKFSTAVLLLFMAVRIVFVSLSTFSPHIDNSPQCYAASLCEFIRPINQVASIGERVLALNAYRYYMRPDLFACSSKADEYTLLQRAYAEGVDAFWEEVYRQGYQYVVYEENFTKKHLLIDLILNPEETPAWMTLESISGASGGDHVVYRLIAENPPFKPEETCNEVSPGLWLVEQVPQ